MKYYWILNAALACSYLVTLCLSKFLQLNPQRELQFQRKSLILTIIIFFLAPFVIAKLPLQYNHASPFQPFIKHASTSFLKNNADMAYSVPALQSSISLPSLSTVLTFAIVCSILFLLVKYFSEILALRKLTQRAYCQRKINRIHILYSCDTVIPFCWSTLFSHFIIIPHAFLEKNKDLKFAILHELQHIRQKDTSWLHAQAFLNLLSFWNPFMKLWTQKLNALQEFACDEALILNKKTSRIHYAQCLIDTACAQRTESYVPNGALGMTNHSQNFTSTLNRRVTMLFNYQNLKKSKTSLITAYAACFILSGTCAYAVNAHTTLEPISATEISTLVKKSNMKITMTPEIIAEINNIRSNADARAHMLASLERMKQYQSYIKKELQNNNMPNHLLAIPLVESGYNVKATGPMLTTGIWQFIPSTALNFGLVVTDNRDDRLDTKLSTKAAINYLSALYSQFHDWNLAVIAYEYGETKTEEFIKNVGSRDAWVIARSDKTPQDLKKFLAMFEASVVVMNHPGLLS